MFYRVRVDLPFLEPDEGNDFYHDCQLALLKASVIAPGEIQEERGFISLEVCHHDEVPPKPCELIDRQEVPD